jgi:hypothetical protein
MTIPSENLLTTIIALFTLFLLPGLAWKGLFWEPGQEFFECLGEIIGVSISLIALGALLLFVLNWNVRNIGLAVLALIGLPLAARGLHIWGLEIRTSFGLCIGDSDRVLPILGSTYAIGKNLKQMLFSATGVAITAGAFLSILLWRFYQSRDLVFPAWVDSVHHTLIVRLFLENGGVPKTFEPYMPVPFYYHYAFHAVTAAFAFLSRAEPAQAVLWLGQVFNALVSVSIYRLVRAVWGDRRRAVLAALLAGFVTQMPAYYLTWGRYTLLTGMVVLPVAMANALDLVNRNISLSRLVTLTVLTGGLLLTHYFAAALLAIFLVILAFQALLGDIRTRTAWRDSMTIRLLASAGTGVALALPWLFHTWSHSHRAIGLQIVPIGIQAVDQAYFPDYLNYLWRLLGPLRNQILLAPALVGLALAAARPRSRGLAVWIIAVCLLSQPWGVYLAPFRPDHAVIVLFLPMAVLIADLIFSLMDWKKTTRIGMVKSGMLFGLCVALLGWGAWGTRTIVNPGTILAGEADRRAIAWIDQNTPQDAKFFINVNHWQFGIYRGSDGGWWITTLTGRETLLPVALYPMGEPAYVQQVRQLAERAGQVKGCTPEFWGIIREEGFDYLYLTVGKGSLQPKSLAGCPGLVRVYEQDGIYIYQVINGASN